MRHLVFGLMAACFLAANGPVAWCEDRWEQLGLGVSDDDANTLNILRHGVVQSHDLEGAAATPDQDWARVVVKPGHSYEARVSGLYWDNNCGLPPCPRFDRVDAAGNVLTGGTPSNDDVATAVSGTSVSIGRTVRWTASQASTETHFLRAIGDEFLTLPATPYDLEFYDTTLLVPRWNNSASQTTVFILKNATNATVVGSIAFFNAAGTLLATSSVNVPEHGAQLVNLAAIPGLSGFSGSAEIAQLGGYGAITGKAVALEPATGFTFDTQITPIPR